MRIRKLELHGFKSFPERTSFHFADGISGVVGPNGCGKSNVIDAVKWCIGEQSARALRGRAMEDVIFNGSAARPPMGMAEVSLTFAATDEPFPGEWARFQELQVTRRLLRGGGSDYYINRQRVRLRDIGDLFLDTGVGNRLYSTIEQGQVGEMIQASPEQRRSLIEEAAGISRYKARRAETIDKLDATLANLDKSKHVVEELEGRLEQLARQVDRAARFRRYRAIHRQGAVFLALVRYGGLTADRVVLSRQERDALREVETRSREVDRQQGLLTREREEVEVQERVVGDLRDKAADREASRRELESARLYQERERHDLEDRSHHLAALVVESERRGQDARKAREKAELEQAQAAGSLSAGEQALASESVRDSRLAEAMGQARQEADRARDALGTSRAAVVRVGTRREGIARQVADIREALRRRTLDLASAEVEGRRLAEIRATTEAQQESHRERLKLAEAAVQEAQGALVRAEEQAARSRKGRVEAESAARDVEREMAGIEARLQTLKDMQTRHVGLADVSRRVLETIPGSFAVAEELVVPEAVQEALAAALGDQVNAVAVRTREEAQRAVSQLRDGVAWIVCLEEEDHPLEGLASQVEGSERARQALGRLLGRCARVPDLASAWDVVAGGAMAVTDDGHVVRPGGVVRAGRPGTGGARILGRRQALNQAEAERAAARSRLESARARLQEAEAQVRQGQDQVQQARGDLDARRAQHREAELEYTGLGHRLRAAVDAASRHQRTLDSMASDASRETERAARMDQELQDLDAQLVEHREESARFEEQQRACDERVRRVVQERAGVAQTLQHLREEVAVLRERVRAGEAARLAAQQALEQADQTLERAREDSRKVAIRQVELAEQEAQTTADIARLAEEQVALAQRLEAERTRLKAVRDQVVRRESLSDQARKVRDEAVLAHREVELKLNETRNQLESVRRRAEEDLGISPPGLLDRLEKNRQLVLAHGLDSEENLPIDLKRLPQVEDLVLTPSSLEDAALVASWEEETEKARRRMDSMGDVNLTAVEEYREVKVRFDTLVAQRDDLEASVSEIRATLARINRTCRDRFREAFDAVNGHFQDLYGRLSGGGQASLQLTSEEDLLETGVEILAQPPGKRLQHLSLLSGGEKAVVAISLIFGLFQVKPSPFCLMDEVDAPLDEGNGARFNDLLRQMSGVSQFIVITHNKKTMECADTLYGVTMPDPGVSRLVTVQVH